MISEEQARKLRGAVAHLGSLAPRGRAKVVKVTTKTVKVYLDFKRASQLAERFAALTLKDPIKGSVESHELTELGLVLDDWRTQLQKLYPDIPEDQLGDVAVNVDPIPVSIQVQRTTVVNVKGGARSTYQAAKRVGMRGVRDGIFSFEDLLLAMRRRQPLQVAA
jgi:hypothetical protein